jgi:hypothetical protein
LIGDLVCGRVGPNGFALHKDQPLKVACPAVLRGPEPSRDECVVDIHERTVEVGAAIAVTVSNKPIPD